MACLSRIIKLNHFTRCFTAVRNLTSNNVTPVLSTLPQISLTSNPWIWQKNDKIELPLTSKREIDLPNGLKYILPLREPERNENFQLPTICNGETKEAARLIVIRRKKMKKHKLRKLRIRMKYEWAKRRQKRELKKEKAFQAVLIKQCKDAEAFSAEKYVEERLKQLNELIALEESNKRKKKKSKLDRL